jgi:hypothetical protein
LPQAGEETGLAADLINTHVDGLADACDGAPAPVRIAEALVPAEARHPHHVHVDPLSMSGHSRRFARLLFDRIDHLAQGRAFSAAPAPARALEPDVTIHNPLRIDEHLVTDIAQAFGLGNVGSVSYLATD